MSGRLSLDLTLGPAIGRGGQGVVYDLPNAPGFAAKRYYNPPDPPTRRHLHHLIAHASPRLMAMAAWPAGLHVTSAGESLLVMPEIPQAREIHDFYGPASRERHFPGATWADCLHVAEQVAATVAEVHAAGFIVADLNEQNFLVSQDLKVTLIDCDSLMSRNDGQTTFGGPYRDEWLPPELIGVDFSSIERTQNHDNFALAMMLFRILMQGRHPFVGVPITAAAPDDVEVIRTHQFVYSGLSSTMVVPESAPNLSILPKRLQEMFNLAFGIEGRRRRPDAKEWQATLALTWKSRRECSADPARHVYAGHLGECPWCDLEPPRSELMSSGPAGSDAARPSPSIPAVIRRHVFPSTPVPRPRARVWRTRSWLQAACVLVSMTVAGGIIHLFVSG